MEFLKNIRARVLRTALFAILLYTTAFASSCERDNTRTLAPTREESVWITDVVLPADEIAVAVGETFEIGGRGFDSKDRFLLETASGTAKIYFLEMEAAADKALLTVPQGLPDGTYTAIVQRAEARQRLGEITLRIREAVFR